MDSPLREYLRNRDSERAPGSRGVGRRTGAEPLRFVVQKHAGRGVHYDLWLEVGGVLKSWAIPRGPSSDPKEQRIALRAEDRPLDCADFEGTLPAPGCGCGTGEVIVWDTGIYSPDEDTTFFFGDRLEAEKRVEHGLEEGRLSLFFWGYKLTGSWVLVRRKESEQEWLLVKRNDLFAEPDRDLLSEGYSVISRRSIEKLREELEEGSALERRA